MRVEITEKRLSTKDRSTGRLYVQRWAKDVDGKVPTGKRRVYRAEVEPRSTTHANTPKEV